MPLRIMQPAQPSVSYQGGGNNRNQVQMAFGNQMSAADRKALNLREEELAFQKDLADRKFSYETKNADRTYDETVRSNKAREATDSRQLDITEAFNRENSPQKRAEAENWLAQQGETRQLAKVAEFYGIPEGERSWEAVARARMLRERTTSAYLAEQKDNMLKQGLFTDSAQLEARAAELGILPEGPPPSAAGSVPSVLNPVVTNSLFDARTPAEARAVANADVPDPTDGTMFEGVGAQQFLRRFADAEARAHSKAMATNALQLAVEASRHELEAINQAAQPLQALLSSQDEAIGRFAELTQTLGLAKQTAEATQKSILTGYPSVIKSVLSNYEKADIKPSTDIVVKDMLTKLPGQGTSFHQLLANPTLAESDEFPGAKGTGLLTNLGLATASKLALIREESRLQREDKARYSRVAPVLNAVRDRLESIELSLQSRVIGDPLIKEYVSAGTKVKLFDSNVRRQYESGNADGAINPDFAREVVQLENAGDPTAGRRFLSAANEQGGTYNPAFEETIPMSIDDTPLGQELDAFWAGADPEAISSDALARSGFTGTFPWDVNKWVFERIGYLPTESRKDFYKSGFFNRALDGLQTRDRKTKEQQAEMRARKAQLDVTKYRPEGVQLKPAPARKTQGGDRPSMKPTQQTKQGYAGGS